MPGRGRHAADGTGRHRAPGTTAASPDRLGVAWAAGIAVPLALVLFLSGAGTPTAEVAAEVPAGASTSFPAGTGARGPIVLTQGAPGAEDLPVRVRIPSIGVDSALVLLGLDDEDALVPPADFARAGWYAGGPVPGDVGPAVIAGHVDSRAGPAVFFRLRDLEPGAAVLIDLADGTTVRFVVAGADRYPKDRFPTEEVYGPTSRAELRLITCGGDFDPDRRSYRDNVVVSAVSTSGS